MAEPSFLDELMEAYNAERFQEIRKTFYTETPGMCRGCPRLLGKSDPPVLRERIHEDEQWAKWWETKESETWPRVLSLNYDPSCNLACPSCRGKVTMWGPGNERYELLKAFQDNTLRKLMRRMRWVHASGYGDPFASPLYQDFLASVTPEEAPDVEYCFLTNGLGFTPKYFETMPTRDRIAQMNVSVDAATEKTYAKVRGGNWMRLLENLAFMARLRRDGVIGKYSWGLVFQAANWFEVPAFLQLAAAHDVDNVTIYTVLPHNHNDEEYKAVAVHEPHHPSHAAAMGVLAWAREKSPVPVYVEVANPERAGQKK